MAFELINKDFPRQAIVTTYICPTNTKGSRIQAKAYGGTRYYHWQVELNIDENHAFAAKKFVEEKGWDKFGGYAQGTLADGRHVFVQVERP
jgi:hypothetical protein